MIGRLLIAAGIVAMVSQVTAERPWQALFAAELLMMIAGGLFVVDEWDEIGTRERLEQELAREAEEWDRRDRAEEHSDRLPSQPLPAS